MAPEEYSSDSEEEYLDDVETDVLLGVSDGEIKSSTDLVDPAVSRMGGLPAFLPSTHRPPHEVSFCKICSRPMRLLVQMWCPFESSPMDRILYVWGCNRSGCQFKDGSIRAYRSLKFNEKYAAKLQKQRAKAKEREQHKTDSGQAQALERPAVNVNPFSPAAADGSKAGESLMFGSGSLFETHERLQTTDGLEKDGAGSSTPQDEGPDEGSDDDEPPATHDELAALTKSLEDATLSDSPSDSTWATSPAYTPLYLSTISEYLAPEKKPQPPKLGQATSHASGLGAGWSSESYERGDTDQVFDKFKRIVGNEGGQCVRYELSGVPLLYQADEVFKKLFPTKGRSSSIFINDRRAIVPPPSDLTKSSYDPSVISTCPICNGPRTFECQLVPNLINLLKTPSTTRKKQTEAERRNELARLLLKKDTGGAPKGGTTADEETGMEWGTCLVFSCLSDCCREAGEKGELLKQCWREEMVLVQWEK